MSRNYKVCVQCHTFNQSRYIEQTLDGFCMQETDFPFVCTIMDDASTDGEQEVIKSYIENNFLPDIEKSETDYAHIWFAQHKNNSNCFFAVLFLKENHYSKGGFYRINEYLHKWQDKTSYIAMCDGDDYWIDPLKLQKQHDLLEAHPEYSLCHHNHEILINGKLEDRKESIPHEQDIISIAQNNTVHTLTMFYRNIGEPLVPMDFPFRYPVYQYFWNLRLAEFGKIIYIDEPMAVYRVNDGGVWSSKSKRQQFIMSIGNLENMIDWYTKGKPRPDVVVVAKKRGRLQIKEFLKIAIVQKRISDLFFILKFVLKYWL